MRKDEFEELAFRGRALNKRGQKVFAKAVNANAEIKQSVMGLVAQLQRPSLPMLRGLYKIAEGILDVTEGYIELVPSVVGAIDAASHFIVDDLDRRGALTGTELRQVLGAQEPKDN